MKKTKLLSLTVAVWMILFLLAPLTAVAAGSAPALPATLPGDPSGIYRPTFNGTDYFNFNATDTALGEGGTMPSSTYGMAYTTIPAMPAEEGFTTTVATDNVIYELDTSVTIPQNSTGFMIHIINHSNSTMRAFVFAPVLNGTARLQSTQGKYAAYWYDSTSSKWGAVTKADYGWCMRLPGNFDGYFYIPFESFGLTSETAAGMLFSGFVYRNAGWTMDTETTYQSVSIVAKEGTQAVVKPVPTIPATLPGDPANIYLAGHTASTGFVFNKADGTVNQALGTLAAADGGKMPIVTRNMAYQTVPVLTPDQNFTSTDINTAKTYNLAAPVTIPKGAVGLLLRVENNRALTNSAFCFAPNIGGTVYTQSYVSAEFGGYEAYYYDSATNAWRAMTDKTAVNWCIRIDSLFDGYYYIPFESFGLTSETAAGQVLSGFDYQVSHWEGGAKIIYHSVDIVCEIPESDTDTWDGTTDITWFDEANLQASYDIDTAEKLAGLAKIIADKGQENYPYCLNQTMVTFRITKNMDLKGLEWLPIGNTHATRFGGNLVGALNGVDGEAVTIKDFKITAPEDDNVGFIGSIDGVSNETGAAVKNLYFENVTVNTASDDSVGVVCGYARSGGVFENIKVTNSTLIAPNAGYAAGICGFSKYGQAIVMNACSYNGTVVANGENVYASSIIGLAKMGAALTNCYAGGQLIIGNTATAVGGLVGSVSDAGKTLTLTDCQVDLNLRVGASVDTLGAAVGSAHDMTLTRVLNTGVTLQVSAEGASRMLPFVGTVLGNATVTANACASMSRQALIGKVVDGAALTAAVDGVAGAPGNVTLQGFTALGGAAAATTLTGFDFDAVWSTREGMYPVLASVAAIADTRWGNMELAWFDPAASTMTVSTLSELVGFARAGQLDPFVGKTVSLGGAIDGSAKLEGQALTVGTKQDGILTCYFLGTYSENGHTVGNIELTFAAEERFTVTWIINGQKYEESYKWGETPVCKQETVKPSDSKFSYEFKNWAPAIVPVTENATYEAIWRNTPIEQTGGEGEGEQQPEPAPTDTEPAPDEEKKGCGSVVLAPTAIVAILAMGIVVFKKKD